MDPDVERGVSPDHAMTGSSLKKQSDGASFALAFWRDEAFMLSPACWCPEPSSPGLGPVAGRGGRGPLTQGDQPMIKLSDTQLVILNAACKRDDGRVLPLPDRLKGGAAAKVVDSLIAKGMIAEVDAIRGEPAWGQAGDTPAVTLAITAAGFAALGITPDEAPQPAAQAAGKRKAAKVVPVTEKAPTAATGATAAKTRPGTKQALLIDLLRRPQGATIAEIVEATGWLPHTARGAMAGTLKKKLGLTIMSEKDETRGRVYRITQ